MSFREKAAWIAVVPTLIIWTYYFWWVWQAYWALTLTGPAVWNLFLICMGITVVLLLGLNIVSAIVGKQRFGADLDELERSVDARANAAGGRLLEWLALGVAASAGWALPQVAAAYPTDPVGTIALVVANAILLVVVVSQVAHEIVHIVSYRVMG
jgi:hypothetical protein